MGQEISAKSIAKKIYEKDVNNLLKSTIEMEKETEIIRETLEISMVGLDNDGRFSVLSQINERIDKGDQSFFDATGISLEKIKTFAKRASDDIKKVKLDKQNDNNKKNKEVTTDKTNDDAKKNEKIEERKNELAPFLNGLSEFGKRIIAETDLEIEANEQRILELMQKGFTREEALNEVYGGKSEYIERHERFVKAQNSRRKAQETNEPNDVKTANQDYAVATILDLKIKINEQKDIIKSLEKELEIATESKKKQKVAELKKARDHLKDLEGELERAEEMAKKQQDAESVIEETETQTIGQTENQTVDDVTGVDNGEKIRVQEDAEIISVVIPKENQVEDNNGIKITQVDEIRSLLDKGVSKEKLITALKRIRNAISKADDFEEFSSYIMEKTTDEDKEFYEMLIGLDYGEDLELAFEGEDKLIMKLNEIRTEIEQSQDIDKTQTEAQPLPEEVSAELNAIPVALQRINCQPEDIEKGMEAYRQMIGLLTPEEINSEPEALTEILKKAVGEINLDGVAGDILKMMSQITFNGQLSEILKNSKDVFLASLSGPLLDPRVYAGNPEQNNSNSSNSSSLTEKVDEDTLKAGFEALAVDLQIADATIIRPEELVTDENAQLENGQEENTEFTKKEDRKEKAEGAVISKLQAFFGVYRNAEMSEVQEVGEEIKDIVQELDLNLQNNNVHRVEEEIKNDEGIEQG